MSAPIGNDYNKKYKDKEVEEAFLAMLNYARTNKDCLSIPDAFINQNIPSSTFYHLVKNFEIARKIKEDISACIISRINREGLHGNFNAAICKHRMQQLGERDLSLQEVRNFNTEVELTKEDLQKAADNLKDLDI